MTLHGGAPLSRIRGGWERAKGEVARGGEGGKDAGRGLHVTRITERGGDGSYIDWQAIGWNRKQCPVTQGFHYSMSPRKEHEEHSIGLDFTI